MDEHRVARLRRADFWTSLVLLALAGLMLKGALGFPITDSYGGVQNVWYVSPALFPLIVATALAVLSLVLLINAVRTGGAAAALRGISGPWHALDEGQRKLALMALLLVGYVYGFIPYVDYVIGTVFFLFAFIAAFHLDDARSARSAAAVFLTVSFTAAAAGAGGLVPGPGSVAARTVDALVLAALLATMAHAVVRPKRRHLGVVIATAAATPVMLAVAFKYGLLVPLPREGLVVGLMDSARYALRALLG